jgi:hypothetical protein
MSKTPMHRAMSGIEIRDSGDGIWDDGAWISWQWINSQIDQQETYEGTGDRSSQSFDEDDGHEPSLELLNRMRAALEHPQHTLDNISPDWGPIGEDYVAERFLEVQLCRPHTQGHDARRDVDLFEIKTISPHKRRAFVSVKRTGNFNVLAVVRVSPDYRLDVRFLRRRHLPAGDGGKLYVVSWRTACRLGSKRPPEDSDGRIRYHRGGRKLRPPRCKWRLAGHMRT